MRKSTIWVFDRVRQNQPVKSQKQARSLKIWIYEEEKKDCKSKGADQLYSYCTVDLCLGMQIVGFLMWRLILKGTEHIASFSRQFT